MTQRLVAFDPVTQDLTGEVARCTLCAQFFIPPEAETKFKRIKSTSSVGRTPSVDVACTSSVGRTSSAVGRTQSTASDQDERDDNGMPFEKKPLRERPLQQKCVYHSGFWTPQRRVRLADNSTLRKCGAMCEALDCGKSCNRYEHRSNVMTHSCGDSRCAENCDMEGCARRCSTRDHFHGTNDPMAIHTCGGSHPCKTPCVCGKKCKFVAGRGEAVHTWHWCGSNDGCSKRCSVAECLANCVNSNHHHHLEEDCFHHCGNEHPCLQLCSAEGCSSKCMLDRENPHKHACHNPHRLGCRVQCSIDECMDFCADPDHFHADISDLHKCAGEHPCQRLCSAPGCKSSCSLSRENPHEIHECLNWHKLRCAQSCSVLECMLPCANVDHFHGSELVEVNGKIVPKIPHLCSGRHVCGHKCTAFGCLASCTVDKAILGHTCLCDGITGCRYPCWFSTQSLKCRNFCASQDHTHESEFHLCSKDHQCKALCSRDEPCLWDGGKKRQQKQCSKLIPAGMTKHAGALLLISSVSSVVSVSLFTTSLPLGLFFFVRSFLAVSDAKRWYARAHTPQARTTVQESTHGRSNSVTQLTLVSDARLGVISQAADAGASSNLKTKTTHIEELKEFFMYVKRSCVSSCARTPSAWACAILTITIL